MAGYQLRSRFDRTRQQSPMRFDTPMSQRPSVQSMSHGGGAAQTPQPPAPKPKVPGVDPGYQWMLPGGRDPAPTPKPKVPGVDPGYQWMLPGGREPTAQSAGQPMSFSPEEIKMMAKDPAFRPLLNRLIALEQSGQVVIDNSTTLDSGAVTDSGTVTDSGAASQEIDPNTGQPVGAPRTPAAPPQGGAPVSRPPSTPTGSTPSRPPTTQIPTSSGGVPITRLPSTSTVGEQNIADWMASQATPPPPGVTGGDPNGYVDPNPAPPVDAGNSTGWNYTAPQTSAGGQTYTPYATSEVPPSLYNPAIDPQTRYSAEGTPYTPYATSEVPPSLLSPAFDPNSMTPPLDALNATIDSGTNDAPLQDPNAYDPNAGIMV